MALDYSRPRLPRTEMRQRIDVSGYGLTSDGKKKKRTVRMK